MSDSASIPSSASRATVWPALLALATAGAALAAFVANSAALPAVLGAWWRPIAVVLAGSALAAAVATRSAWRGAFELGVAWRLAFSVLVATWLAFLAWAPPFQRLWLQLALGASAGVWCLALFGARELGPRRPRSLRVLERTLFALALGVVLLELGLRGLARCEASPLLARAGDAEGAVIERFRCAPGLVRFGFPCNSRGFYDDEFRRRAQGERLIAVVGDSFLLGTVPHALNWTTLCERALGVPLANLGVAGSGPREYARLVVDEALPLDPEVVVVSVFVGNDLELDAGAEELPDAWLREVASRERVLLFTLAARLSRLSEEAARVGDGGVAKVQGEREGPVAAAELERAFPWLADPTREEATLSSAAFLRLETERALRVCRVGAEVLARFERQLVRIRDACRDRRLLVVLVPDEFQVEDELWRSVSASANVALERDRPQRELGDLLARAGIARLDLLPALRAIPPLADGRRHLYHLRDTHFNARGNRVAAEELARALDGLLGR